jgi:hypothetical protein
VLLDPSSIPIRGKTIANAVGMAGVPSGGVDLYTLSRFVIALPYILDSDAERV